MRLLIEATFWVCAGGVLYIYAGYPLLVWLSARLVPHPVAKAPFVGQVSVVISVRNEASLICSKMEQLLASPDAALVAEVHRSAFYERSQAMLDRIETLLQVSFPTEEKGYLLLHLCNLLQKVEEAK